MKVLSFVMALVMIVGTLAVIPFSAAKADEHKQHTKGDLVKTVAPTCTLYGYSVYKCAECGESYITDVTEKLEHEYQEVGEVPATCETEGHNAYMACVNCGYYEEGALEVYPKAHVEAYKIVGGKIVGDIEEVDIFEVENCEEGVKYAKYCKICGEILEEDNGFLSAEHPHTLRATVVKAPTCSEVGIANLYCEECNYTLEDVVIEKIAHTWEWKTQAATFEYNKYDYKQCKVCGAIEEDDDGVVKYHKVADGYEEGDYAYTSHAFILEGKEYDALVKELKAGDSKTYIDTMDNDRKVVVSREACNHKWEALYFAFDMVNGETTTKVKSTDARFVTDADSTAGEKFIAEYAKYSDVYDLYGVFQCKKCAQVIDGETIYLKKTETLLNAAGHQYVEEYTFRFKYEVPTSEGTELVSYVKTFKGGYNNIIRACETYPIRERLCAICKANGSQIEAERIKIGEIQEHSYTWLCQNLDCSENVAYVDEDGENQYEIVIGRDKYYVCTNCTHKRRQVCFNEKTVIETNEAGYCLDMKAWVEDGAHDAIPEDASKILTAEATCTKPSYKYYVCSKCGTKIEIAGTEEGDVVSTNHDWSIHRNTRIITEVLPTCVTPGKREIYCNNYGCEEYITEDIAVLGDEYHTFDKYVPDSTTSILRTNDTGAAANIEIKAATCANPETWKLFCTVCRKFVYVVNPDNPKLDGKVLANHKNIETVEAKDPTCTTDATFAYEYCKDCGTITKINGEVVVDKLYNIAKNLDKVINTGAVDPRAQLFLEIEVDDDPCPTWDLAYHGDSEHITADDYEVIKFADGSVMCYYLKHGIGHDMYKAKPAQKQTCFQAGWDDQYECAHNKDNGYTFDCTYGQGGDQVVPPTGHPNRKEMKLKDEDKDRVEEYPVTLNTFAKNYANELNILELHGLVKNEDGSVKTTEGAFGWVTYYLTAVMPTCEKDGYIVGYYCEDCMGTIKDEDGNDILNTGFSAKYNRDYHLAGYALAKLGHSYTTVEGVHYEGEHVCGAEFYTYDFKRCTRCDDIRVTNYADAEFTAHKADAWKYTEEKPEGVNAGDAKIYTLVIRDGKFVEKDTVNDYVECRDYVYTAKKCVNCPEGADPYFDVEVLKVPQHFTKKYIGDTEEYVVEAIDLSCKKYQTYIGLYCDICGYRVPNVIVEKDELGRDVENYYSKDGEKLIKVGDYYVDRTGKKYFALDHDWAEQQDDCEAVNANIKACSVCGINVVNEDAKVAAEARADAAEANAVFARNTASGMRAIADAAETAKNNAETDKNDAKDARDDVLEAIGDKLEEIGKPSVEADQEQGIEAEEATGLYKDLEDAKAELAQFEAAHTPQDGPHAGQLDVKPHEQETYNGLKDAVTSAETALNNALAELGEKAVEADEEQGIEAQEATGLYADLEAAEDALGKAEAALNIATFNYNFANNWATYYEGLADIAEDRAESLRDLANNESNAHRYLLRNGETAEFVLKDYDNYAFDDVTYPTASEKGHGTLTCVLCGKKLDVTIPVYDLLATAKFDSSDVALVGGKVTVTVKISASDFEFNTLEFYVTNLKNTFDLVDVEVLYDFAAIDAVDTKIDANGNFTITKTAGIKPVAISGNKTPFVKLTFKLGDMTDAAEINEFKDFAIIGVRRLVCDATGKEVAVDGSVNIADCKFGTLKVYNPAFKLGAFENKADIGSSIGVLAQVYAIDFAGRFDFNSDGRVDLNDYFAMVDFVASERSIADFCALINYDIDAMLDTLDYSRYSSGKGVEITSGWGKLGVTVSEGTEQDIIDAKEVIKAALNDTYYYDIVGEYTIAAFAQSVIKPQN